MFHALDGILTHGFKSVAKIPSCLVPMARSATAAVKLKSTPTKASAVRVAKRFFVLARVLNQGAITYSTTLKLLYVVAEKR